MSERVPDFGKLCKAEGWICFLVAPATYIVLTSFFGGVLDKPVHVVYFRRAGQLLTKKQQAEHDRLFHFGYRASVQSDPVVARDWVHEGARHNRGVPRERDATTKTVHVTKDPKCPNRT